MTERITIDLPEPEHVTDPGGLRRLLGYNIADVDDPAHPGKPKVGVDGMQVHLVELERIALAMLWMVRGHRSGDGLACEVVTGGGRHA